MSKPVLLLLSMIYSAILYAQSGKLFTVDSDLSSSMVSDLHQDRNGYVWIATEDGLNRFDGIKFMVYRHNKHDPNSMLNDIVWVLSEDRHGRMYVGYINGLQYYDAASDSFHEIPLIYENGDRVGAHVMAILQRKNGQVLIGTSGHGLFELHDGKDGPYGLKSEIPVPTNMVVALFEDKEERLWVSTEDMGLFKLGDRKPVSYFASKRVQNNVISSICEDKYGILFVGSMNSGLHRYDTATDSFIHIPYRGHANLPVAYLRVSSTNRLYIATNGNGVKYYDAGSDEVMDLELNVSAFNFATSKANSILEDNAGNIWMGIFQRGVFLLPPYKNSFGYIGHKSTSKNLIGSNCVMSVFEDSKGTIWVGTDNDGLYAVMPGGEASTHYKCRNGGSSVPSTVMTIFEDSQGGFWVGSYLDGLAKFDRKTGKSTYVTGLVDKRGDNVQRIFSIKEDEQQRLWIASMGSGLFCLDPKTDEIKHFDAVEGIWENPMGNHLPNSWINCLLLSRNNKLYVGTYDGLACLDLETESFVTPLGTNKLLAGLVVYSLYDDNQGNLWVGTSKGLMHLDVATKQITAYDVDDGLPSNVICAIEGDKQGNVWVSTNRGIAKMEVDEKRFLNFYSGDGLQGNEFTQRVSLTAGDGDLYFGGINGITRFKPSEIRVQNKKLTVHIVDFYIHDKAVKKGTKSGNRAIVDTAVNHAKEFHLAYHDNSFSVEFSTMDFSDSERVVFQYTVNDNEWVALRPGNNRVTFDKLEAGVYKLRIRARSNDTYSDVKEARIVIHPVWFQSPLAKWGYALVALGLAFFIVKTIRNRHRIRQQMLAHQQAEEMNEAKLQFFIHIAHEIRTPLTLIVSPLKKLMDRESESEPRHLYNIMDRNVQRILDLVNQLMDIRKIEKGLMNLQFERVEMTRFTDEICSLFEEQIAAKHIHFAIDHRVEKVFSNIDPRNFDKVLINIMSNACKFTPIGGSIHVALDLVNQEPENTGQPCLMISVADSGPQIAEKEMDSIFECFYQSERGNQGLGTGIGLYLAKQLVALHNGTIHVENLEGIGCRFVLMIPGAIHRQSGETHQSPSIIHDHVRTLAVDNETDGVAAKKAKRLVIVDDDTEIRNYLKSEFAADYAVVAYANGEDAYRGILKEAPDLVVSDVVMPGMDGMMLCRKLKSSPLVNHVPVVLLTAKTEEMDCMEGYEYGADAYVTKPFNISVLQKNIKSLIRNREIVRNNEREHRLQDAFISKINLKSADEILLEKVHRIINNNLNNPRLSVEMISAEIGISRVHLHRKLKELTSLTTRDLIRDIRLKQAAELISQKGLNVSEVAFAVGYADVGSFSVAFKQFHGVAPTDYQ
ncbi:two-component regulator propeller domain-containing protein [Parapedobacter tibetensis]|uniref:two-component regulator propeller domain-containing protein n=1 Tax=Parapedobacter tibetensis TaxID=2972951 RepID=UPI00214DECF1|nr:two-component regulator propeller domain-containing protein [Parapedobacter tibetensis]